MPRYRKYQEAVSQSPFGGKKNKGLSSRTRIKEKGVRNIKLYKSLKPKKSESCKICKKRFANKEAKKEHEAIHFRKERKANRKVNFSYITKRVGKLKKEETKHDLDRKTVIETLTKIRADISTFHDKKNLGPKQCKSLQTLIVELFPEFHTD